MIPSNRLRFSIEIICNMKLKTKYLYKIVFASKHPYKKMPNSTLGIAFDCEFLRNTTKKNENLDMISRKKANYFLNYLFCERKNQEALKNR